MKTRTQYRYSGKERGWQRLAHHSGWQWDGRTPADVWEAVFSRADRQAFDADTLLRPALPPGSGLLTPAPVPPIRSAERTQKPCAWHTNRKQALFEEKQDKMKQEQEASKKAATENEEQRRRQDASLLCPICFHPLVYSKKFQCRRCGYMPG